MKKLFKLALLSLTLLSLIACEKNSGAKIEEKSMKIRIAENHPENYPTTKGDKEFARLVEEKTKGRIKVEVHFGAALGEESSVAEQVKLGTIEMTRISISPLTKYSEKLSVLSLPYLYESEEQYWKVLDGPIGEEYLEMAVNQGFRGLSWYDSGARSFYNTKKEIRTPNDMNGLKFRVQDSQLMMALVTALGANPTPIPNNETYGAMQTGTIDGAENNYPSFVSGSHSEVAKFYTEDEHTRVPEGIFISEKIWQKLSEGDKKILKDSALAAAIFERELWKAYSEETKNKAIESGVKITVLTPEEKQAFADKMGTVYEKYSKYQAEIDRIKAVK